MRRVVVIGNSGSGRTTVARKLAAALVLPHLELDGVANQPGWTTLPNDQLRERVGTVTAGDAWVVDGNYSAIRDVTWARADTVVWLDPPRAFVTWQVVRRTAMRCLRRTQLWNGNRESLRNALSHDPDRSIVLWSWRQHDHFRQMYTAAMRDPAWSGWHWVRLRSRREVQRFLRAAE